MTSALVLPKRPGFLHGVRALLGGFGFVLGRPGVWPLAAVPVGVALALTILLSWAGIRLATSLLGRVSLGASTAAGVVAFVLELLATLAVVLVAALVGFGLAQPLSGAAHERIVRRVEASMGAPAWPEPPALEGIVRSLQSVLVAAAIGLPVFGVLLVVGLVVPGAAVVTFPLKLLATALLAAWDLCDYPLSIRGLPIGERVARVRRHAGAMLGFGFGIALVGLVPFALVLVLPAGVAGAARLMVDLERWDEASGGARALSPGDRLRSPDAAG
jgi:CysZ protein